LSATNRWGYDFLFHQAQELQGLISQREALKTFGLVGTDAPLVVKLNDGTLWDYAAWQREQQSRFSLTGMIRSNLTEPLFPFDRGIGKEGYNPSGIIFKRDALPSFLKHLPPTTSEIIDLDLDFDGKLKAMQNRGPFFQLGDGPSLNIFSDSRFEPFKFLPAVGQKEPENNK
jgi:hypothetical protein